jgi:hypothetical protein
VGVWFQKGSSAWGRWPGDARCGHVHVGACGREVRGKEGANRRGQRERAHGEWGGADRRDTLVEGERRQWARAGGRAGADRRDPLVIRRDGAGARASWFWWAERLREGGAWLLWLFLFLLNCYSLFFFIFLF